MAVPAIVFLILALTCPAFVSFFALPLGGAGLVAILTLIGAAGGLGLFAIAEGGLYPTLSFVVHVVLQMVRGYSAKPTITLPADDNDESSSTTPSSYANMQSKLTFGQMVKGSAESTAADVCTRFTWVSWFNPFTTSTTAQVKAETAEAFFNPPAMEV